MALRFNGTSSRCVTSTLSLSSYSQLAVSFWLYWNVYANDYRLAFSSSTTSILQGAIYISPNAGDFPGTFIILVRVDDSNWNGISMSRPSALTWHHYTINYDRNGGAQQVVSVYVDGISQSLTQIFTNTTSAGGFGDHPWYFMSHSTPVSFGNGKLAEVSLFPGVNLNREEVLSLYYGTNPLELRADVKPYYWKMEGDAQLYSQDSSAQSLDFTPTAVEIDNHPPIGLEFDFWHSSSVENLPQGGGNLLDILAELAFRGSSEFLSNVNRLGSSENHVRIAIFSDIQRASALYSEKHGSGSFSSNTNKISSLYAEQHGRASFQSDLLKYIGLTSNIATNLNLESNSYRESLLNMVAALNLSVDSSITKQSNLDSYFNGNLDAYFNSLRSSDLQLTTSGRLSLSGVMANSASIQSYFNQRGVLESSISNNKDLVLAVPLNSDLSSSILASYNAGFIGEGRLSLFGETATDGSISLDVVLITNSDLGAILSKNSESSMEFLGRTTISSDPIKESNLSLDILGNLDFYSSMGVARNINLDLMGDLDLAAQSSKNSELLLSLYQNIDFSSPQLTKLSSLELALYSKLLLESSILRNSLLNNTFALDSSLYAAYFIPIDTFSYVDNIPFDLYLVRDHSVILNILRNQEINFYILPHEC